MPRLILIFVAAGLACSRSEVATSGPAGTATPPRPVDPVGPAEVAPASPAKPATPAKPVTSAETFARDDRAAVFEAWQAATGRKLGEHDCVEWPAAFPRVVVVGSFAHDRGCHMDGLFVDRRFHAADGEVAGLATRNFAGATSEQKQALARSWVEEVVQAFGGRFLTESTMAFDFPGVPKFAAPRAAAGPGGGVVVTGWENVPPGMVDEDAFNFMVYSFTTEGRMSAKLKRDFAVEGEKLRAREAAGKPGP